MPRPFIKKIYLFLVSSCTSTMSITCSHPNRRAPESPNITPRGFPQGPLCAITTPWEALCLHLSSALPPKLTPLQLSSTWLFKGGRGLDTLWRKEGSLPSVVLQSTCDSRPPHPLRLSKKEGYYRSATIKRGKMWKNKWMWEERKHEALGEG